MVALIFATGVWTILAWGGSWWSIVTSQLAFGVMVCSTFACLHETAHGTAFKTKKFNQLSAFLCGLLHVYPSSLFRELHFTHHRHTHVPGRDPEISLGNRPAPSAIANLPMYLGWMTGLPLLSFKVGMLICGAIGMPEAIRTRLFPFIDPRNRQRIAVESTVVLLLHGLILALAVVVNPAFWALIIGQVVGHCLLAAYLTPEHNGLDHEGTIMDKTRSMETSRWVRLVMWNMPYHAEHHAYPAVPFHALPDLSLAIGAELKHRTNGYTGFHSSIIRRHGGPFTLPRSK